MPVNTEAQRQRRRDTWHSVIAATVILILTGGVLLTLAWYLELTILWRIVLAVAGLFELGMLIPVWKLLKIRLLEIEGGEEDAASKY